MARRRVGRDLSWGAGWGLFAGMVFGIFAATAIALQDGLGTELEHVSVPVLLAMYPAIGVLGGLVVGFFRPAVKTRRGAMLVGILAAFPGEMALLSLFKGPVPAWDGFVWFGAVGGAIILGSMGGYIWWGQLHDADPGVHLRKALALNRRGADRKGRRSSQAQSSEQRKK